MNYRDYKIFFPGGVYHIFNRGVNRQDICRTDSDYSLFLWRLKEQILSIPLPLAKHNSYRRKVFQPGLFQMLAYCIMPNHFHLLVRQLGDTPVSELLLRVMTGYSKVFNIKYERIGSLFQDQFKMVRAETDEQLLWLSAYIHQNPKVAGLVQDLYRWPWSSYLDYVGGRGGQLAQTSYILGFPEFLGSAAAYKEFVDNTYQKIKDRKDLEILLLDNV